ncbi:MAG: UbiH/UbiF/VisC/COQ6 family ubiquinone biosynthesis hydroxylase [Gammaproteobacteria bacterium]|nr:UbiH/UbiF/VisC/COQ6 family ubiquinone biosynthesis hydroxylase [Gammaproteobacteria bacterium]
MTNNTFDVVIVGGGMVGLACALALAQANFRIAVVESSTQEQQEITAACPFDTKVVAITRASENLFKNLGVWQKIEEARLCSYKNMKVWDSALDGAIAFSAMDFFERNLGHIVEQSIILWALQQALKEHINVTLMTGAKLGTLEILAEHVELNLVNGKQLKSLLIIGADGANSLVRQLCGIEIAGWEYEQSAIVATVEGEYSHEQTAYQRFASDGPLALLPLASSHHCSIVWTTSPEEAEVLCRETPERFAERLTRESHFVMGKMRLVGTRLAFPLRTQHVKQYAVSRCALIGDAAHTLHPLAGQGVNLGFLDVAALVNVVTEAKKKKRDIGTLNTLKRYERQRKTHNQIMIWMMEFFKRGFCSQSNIIQRLRNVGLNWVDRHTSIKQLFAKMALGTLGPIPPMARMRREA